MACDAVISPRPARVGRLAENQWLDAVAKKRMEWMRQLDSK